MFLTVLMSMWCCFGLLKSLHAFPPNISKGNLSSTLVYSLITWTLIVETHQQLLTPFKSRFHCVRWRNTSFPEHRWVLRQVSSWVFRAGSSHFQVIINLPSASMKLDSSHSSPLVLAFPSWSVDYLHNLCAHTHHNQKGRAGQLVLSHSLNLTAE